MFLKKKATWFAEAEGAILRAFLIFGEIMKKLVHALVLTGLVGAPALAMAAEERLRRIP